MKAGMELLDWDEETKLDWNFAQIAALLERISQMFKERPEAVEIEDKLIKLGRKPVEVKEPELDLEDWDAFDVVDDTKPSGNAIDPEKLFWGAMLGIKIE